MSGQPWKSGKFLFPLPEFRYGLLQRLFARLDLDRHHADRLGQFGNCRRLPGRIGQFKEAWRVLIGTPGDRTGLFSDDGQCRWVSAAHAYASRRKTRSERNLYNK